MRDMKFIHDIHHVYDEIMVIKWKNDEVIIIKCLLISKSYICPIVFRDSSNSLICS